MWGTDLEIYLLKIYLEDGLFIECTVTGYSAEHALETACYDVTVYSRVVGKKITLEEFKDIVYKARDGKLEYSLEEI